LKRVERVFYDQVAQLYLPLLNSIVFFLLTQLAKFITGIERDLIFRPHEDSPGALVVDQTGPVVIPFVLADQGKLGVQE